MNFPKRIKHRGRVLATIYGKGKGRDSYRVAWQVSEMFSWANILSENNPPPPVNVKPRKQL